jgi:serine/threonine protein kinase/Flp pilus assembly protein TadD
MSESVRGSAVSGDVDRLVAEVVAEVTDRLHAGQPVDIEHYAARHPELAERLRGLVPALQALAHFSSAADPVGLAPGAAGGAVCGTLGDFRLLREVGRGGMGIVYEAEQISLGRRVALKVLPFAATMDPRHLQRFHNEARAAASLHHEHIVPVYAVGEERAVHFYAMQFIPGQTLAAFIAGLRQRGGRTLASDDEPTTPHLPGAPAPTTAAPDTVARAAASTEAAALDPGYFRHVAELGAQAAEALEHAHQLGIVHRDIKPANLLVDGRGHLWVTDFGLARLGADAGLTLTGDLLGTLRYMSPEQALARHGLVDHRSDIYSLGATLYELLTLRPAVAGEDRQEILRAIAFEEPAPPRRRDRAIPPDLETIALKALEKDPEGRYATARELADDLRRFLEDRPIRAKRPAPVQRLLKWSKRHQAAMAATCLFLLLAAIGLAIASVLIWREKAETGKALAWAEKQEQLAREQAARAVAQRERAESNLHWSIQAAHCVLAHLDGEEFADVPAAPEVRRRLTAQAVRLFQEHVDESSADPGVRYDTACIYLAIGSLHSGQGDHHATLAAFEKAATILEELTLDSPNDAKIWMQLGRVHFHLGDELASLGRMPESAREFRRLVDAFSHAFRVDPSDSRALNSPAWHLATWRVASARDPARAVALASKAVALRPEVGGAWNTLGVAQYRTGDWRAAVASLTKSISLRQGGNSFDWFFLAMARWQLGDKEEARRWYDKAVRWAKTNPVKLGELRPFSAEAARLLGIEDALAPRDRANSKRKE